MKADSGDLQACPHLDNSYVATLTTHELFRKRCLYQRGVSRLVQYEYGTHAGFDTVLGTHKYCTVRAPTCITDDQFCF